MPFSSINKFFISVNNSNSTSAFFKHGRYATRGAGKSELDQAHLLQYTYCENFQIYLQAITCHFEGKNYDTHLDFLF